MCSSWSLTRVTRSGHVQSGGLVTYDVGLACLLVFLQVQCDGCGAGDAPADGGVWWAPGSSCCQTLLPNV
jgi:hypothetical protein